MVDRGRLIVVVRPVPTLSQNSGSEIGPRGGGSSRELAKSNLMPSVVLVALSASVDGGVPLLQKGLEELVDRPRHSRRRRLINHSRSQSLEKTVESGHLINGASCPEQTSNLERQLKSYRHSSQMSLNPTSF